MKLMAVRLPDDVAAAVEREAEKQERSKSAVVVRALRLVLGVTTVQETAKALKVARAEPRNGQDFAMPPDLPREPEKISENPRFRKCQHGGNEYTCERIACKIKTGRG